MALTLVPPATPIAVAQALAFVDIEVDVTTTDGTPVLAGAEFAAGTPLVFSVTVSPRTPGAAPTGTVAITDLNTSFGEITLTPGAGTASGTGQITLPEGDLFLYAEYSGDASYESGSEVIGPFRIVGRGFTEAYVRELYTRLLGRPADEQGLTHYADMLESGVPRWVVAQTILSSREAAVLQVTRAYDRILGRPPDSAGLATYTDLLQRGVPLEDVEAIISGSPENVAYHGRDWGRFVYYVYDEVGIAERQGRTPPPIVAAPWVVMLAAGRPPIEVVMAMYDSPEIQEYRVEDAYNAFLDRGSDPFGAANALAFLQGGGRMTDLWVTLVASDEFFGKITLP